MGIRDLRERPRGRNGAQARKSRNCDRDRPSAPMIPNAMTQRSFKLFGDDDGHLFDGGFPGAGYQCQSPRFCPHFVPCPPFVLPMSYLCPTLVLVLSSVLLLTCFCLLIPSFVLIQSSICPCWPNVVQHWSYFGPHFET